MPVKDETAWKQNEDGSWSRRNAAGDEETTFYAETVAASQAAEGLVNATAGAIAAADEYGVDLSTVTGSGSGGRITKGDVEAATKED